MKKESLTTRVTRGDDGKYRWVYEMNLFKNPTILILVWSIFFFIFLFIFGIVIFSDIQWGAERVLNDFKFLGYFILGMTAVVLLGYLIYAAMMGGKYVVEFEMDQTSICHRQIASQAKKAKKLAGATILTGAATGKFSTIGAGIAASRTEMTSEFAKVRKIKVRRRLHVIKLNERLEHNQVYVMDEDFDFVLNYIKTRCTNAKQ